MAYLPVTELEKQEPIFGILRYFRQDPLKFIDDVLSNHDTLVSGKMLRRQVFILMDTDLVHDVLVRHGYEFEKSPLTKQNMEGLLGKGLLLNDGDAHKQQRKLVQPAFHRQRIMSYADTMSEYTKRLVERWASQTQTEIHTDMMQLTMEIVGKALFDADVSQGEAQDVGEALDIVLREGSQGIMNPIRQILRRLPLPHNRQNYLAVQRLNNIVLNMIEARRASGEDKGDLLSMLLLSTDHETGASMSDTQVRDEAITLFLAGHETTANALTWSIYLLTQHPDIYERAYHEVQTVLGEREITLDDIPKLPTIDHILKESMRLYPPAWITSRYAPKDIVIGNGKYHIPTGSVVLVSPYLFHHHPHYWDNPTQFNIDRWQTHGGTLKDGYFPFGGGPRICIGNHFAMMEMVIVLATLVQHYRFSKVSSATLTPDPVITLRPKEPFYVQLASTRLTLEKTL